MQALIARLLALQVGKYSKSLGVHWKLITIVALILIILYQNVSDTRWVFWADTIPYLKEELATAEYSLNIAIEGNVRLREVIESNNARIRQWEIVSNSLELQHQHLQGQLSEVRQNTNVEVRTIIKEVTPQSCEAAFEYLRDNIPNLNFEDILNGDDLK